MLMADFGAYDDQTDLPNPGIVPATAPRSAVDGLEAPGAAKYQKMQ